MTTLQDQMAEAVQYGRMTPSEADEKLESLGLPPLAPQPNPDDFDPMIVPWWSLSMVVSWIVWRARADVREAWDEFRREGSFWSHERWRVGFDGPINEGWLCKPKAPASLALVKLKEIYQRCEGTLPSGAVSVADAIKLLRKASGAGALHATGLSTANGSRIPIPDYEWPDLAEIEEKGRDVLRQRERHGYSRRGYDDVLFRSRDVVAIWPADRGQPRDFKLAPPMSPHAPGHMPLYCAAHWIVTEGGKHEIDPMYVTLWERAYREVLDRIASDQVTITGVRNGVREKLEGYLFASIAVAYPFAETPFDLILSDEMHLESYCYVEDEQWRKGYDDCLRDKRGVRWAQLLVPKAHIARWWPFHDGAKSQVPPRGAGRPSKMAPVFAEFERRRKCGELEERIGNIAASLEAWMRSTLSSLEAPSADTIANELRRKGYWPIK
jgi:hypothetical protein